jgi:thiamine-phosphate pyrophosphorylase
MSIKEARSILGVKSSELLQTLLRYSKPHTKVCDYIGLGPFRFTTTKKNLSPILGLEGYQTILNEMKNKGLQFQYAIGGIEMTFLH